MFRFNNSRYVNTGKSIHSYFNDDYRNAVATLNTLQDQDKLLPGSATPKCSKISKFVQYLSICGLEIQALEKNLSIIHVSGTKGKGSTCAYSESILRHLGYKTAFYSSPHLVSVRERIKINGEPLSKEKFTSYFWQIYDKLQNDKVIVEGELQMPGYFMFLTVMAFKVFMEEQNDVAIIEVGIGGELDCTNILRNTAVAGISSLGYDHVKLLGNTLEEIAWQKAGILKPGCIAITSANQPESAFQILRQRALERNCKLFVAPQLYEYPCSEQIKLGIEGSMQLLNAALALQLVNAWVHPQLYIGGDSDRLQMAPVYNLTNEILRGLKVCRWLGRTQVMQYSGSLVYYLDGAHTKESMEYCVHWFTSYLSPQEQCTKVLVFNVKGNRNVGELLKFLIPCQFDYVCFCTNRIERLADSIDSSIIGHQLFLIPK